MNDPIQVRKQAWESAAEEASAAAKSFMETQFIVLESKVGFFEKLALFDTGTIAATITMAGSLRQHEALHWKYTLFTGWLLLLIAMGLCLFRNFNTHSHRFYASLANYKKKDAESIAARAAFQAVYPGALVNELGETWSREEFINESEATAQEFRASAEEYKSKSSHHYGRLMFSENAAIVLTLAGVASLLVFTVHSFF